MMALACFLGLIMITRVTVRKRHFADSSKPEMFYIFLLLLGRRRSIYGITSSPYKEIVIFEMILIPTATCSAVQSKHSQVDLQQENRRRFSTHARTHVEYRNWARARFLISPSSTVQHLGGASFRSQRLPKGNDNRNSAPNFSHRLLVTCTNPCEGGRFSFHADT